MCVAIVVPEGADFPSLETLQQCEIANSDGGGMAWVSEGKVEWMKGMDAEDMHAFGQMVDGPVLLHFRLATAGGASDEMAHPFPIEKKPRIDTHGRANKVLIHNGHWSDWEFIAEISGASKGMWSDTRLMARLIALHGVSVVQHLSTDGQKLAILDKNGEFVIVGKWDLIDGVHFSNNYWEYQYSYPGAGQYGNYSYGQGNQGYLDKKYYDDDGSAYDEEKEEEWWRATGYTEDTLDYAKPWKTAKKKHHYKWNSTKGDYERVPDKEVIASMDKIQDVMDICEAVPADHDVDIDYDEEGNECTVRYLDDAGQITMECVLPGWADIQLTEPEEISE